MTSVIFQPASDGLSRPAADLINSHLRNSFYYGQWVSDSPLRKQIDTITIWFQTHPNPFIWTENDTFALGVASLFDSNFSPDKAPKVSLDNKPSTAYLIALSTQKYVIGENVLLNLPEMYAVLENTPSGESVLYYRNNSQLAIRKVSFDVFQRNLDEICSHTTLRMQSELAYRNTFGINSLPQKLTASFMAISYPDLSRPLRLQPYSFKKECILWLKVGTIFAFLAIYIASLSTGNSFKGRIRFLSNSAVVYAVNTVCTLIIFSILVYSSCSKPYRGPLLR